MKSWSFFQFSTSSVSNLICVSSVLSLIASLGARQLHGLIELLQIVEQQMRPRPIHSLNLADDPFFKIEPALSPAKDFGHCSFAFQRAVNRVSHHAVVQIDFAV